jgi:hypothetical protein
VHFRVVERIWRQTRDSCHNRAPRNREREAVLLGNARRADGRDFVTNLLCVVAIEDLHARTADYKLCGCIRGCGSWQQVSCQHSRVRCDLSGASRIYRR